MLRLHRFDPSPCQFPPPVCALLPPPRWLARRPPPDPRDARDGRLFRHHTRGRYALHAAFAAAGLRGAQDRLLLPAYHCRTMVDPALSLGLQIELYPLRADLSPDLDRLQALLQAPGAERRALLLTHYFGFAQELRAIKAICDAAGVTLIEDASHAFVTDPALGQVLELGGEIGRIAEIGVASPYKFLPSPDGGLLWTAAGRATPPPTRSPGLGAECRAVLNYARALFAGRPAPPPAREAAAAPAREWLEPLQTSVYYQAELEGLASLALTRWLMRRADARAIASARRERYRRWSEAVADLPGARALKAQLGEHTVPYMFPLLLDSAEPFGRLKAAGLPIWRWDEQVESGCAVSAAYRQRLLHLPCHEGLDEQDLALMSGILRRVLVGAAA